MNKLNEPSFFRKGGLLTPLGGNGQRTTVGRNMDGSYYIEIAGPTSARAVLTPLQAFQFATGLLEAMGYRLDKPPAPPPVKADAV